ncbi:zinc finger BED domain-containing protein 4-like [Bacillus rossius redtenbacheri]|uniref:zinc finger BED domain-containing protein 4-like n=1 Tax=Bacillus rossius redtenbacheri TaxID=93214 RepID=UPI002FDD40F5
MSDVWNHFTVCQDDEKFARCNYCRAKISRGHSKTTSNLMKHFRNQHKLLAAAATKKFKVDSSEFDDPSVVRPSYSLPDISVQGPSHQCQAADIPIPGPSHQDQTPETEMSGSDSLCVQTAVTNELIRPKNLTVFSSNTFPKSVKCVQSTLPAIFDARMKFKPGDHRAADITRLIGEMICLDNQPLCIVENKGFRQLISKLEPRYTIPTRKTFSQKIIPEMYEKVRDKVVSQLKVVEFIGVTTDMWSSSSNDDYMSLTLHYMDTCFNLQHVCLEVIPFSEISHTAEHICDFITKTLEEWGLREKVFAIVSDNARNVQAGLEMSQFQHTSCFAHSIQLVLKNGFFSNKVITNLAAICRRIVVNFKHSSKANKILRKCQETVGVPHHRLIQDEPTRWNATLHMFKRLQEQKLAILLAAGELKLPNELTAAQWNLLDNAIAVLQVFESATLQVSSASARVSEVIPLLQIVDYELSKPAPTPLNR